MRLSVVSWIVYISRPELDSHLPSQIDVQKLPRLSPSPGNRHDSPVMATAILSPTSEPIFRMPFKCPVLNGV
jgi:hypothetical protein